MWLRPAQLGIAFLLLAAPHGETLTARWSLKATDLAIWDVFLLPATEGGFESPLPRDRSLALYGYQIDRKGEARYRAHWIDEIPLDLALRVPLGKVREGQAVRTVLRYDHIRDHRPLEVALSGKVVEIDGSSFRLEGKLLGAPAEKFDRGLQGGKAWLTRLSGEVGITFDCEKGWVSKAVVRLKAESHHIDEGKREDAPKPMKASHDMRFEFRKVRDFGSWKSEIAAGRAILKGTEWLRGKLQGDGTYGVYDYHRKYPHAETCFAALTLLVCGADRKDPFILDLMEHIRGFQPTNTYELGVALMAMEAFYAPPDEVDDVHAGRSTSPRFRKLGEEDRLWVQDLVDRLIALAEKKPDGWGWGYNTELSRPDLSNTQYASLGLLSGWRCGARIPEEVWVQMANGTLRHQTGKGKHPLKIGRESKLRGEGTRSRGRPGKMTSVRGFAYEPGWANPRASMTCGGIATLRIARDVLRAERSVRLRGLLEKRIEDGIRQGWAWMAREWLIQRHPPEYGRDWHLYYLYALERAGILCRVVQVNGRDWYHEGASWLVETQHDDGHWQGITAAVHDTCFALLFLKRATLPIPEPTGAGR